jgi:hypothetical protein
MGWIWVALILALVATLALCTVILFRKGIRVLSALGDLLSAPAILDGVHRAELEPRHPAVLDAPSIARAQLAHFASERLARKERRRKRRFDRARELVGADVGLIATRLAGLDSSRRRVGGAYTKDD